MCVFVLLFGRGEMGSAWSRELPPKGFASAKIDCKEREKVGR